MINLKNVSKYYGSNLGISDISFTVEKNEIIGLLGENGAGKTTIMNIATGYISSDEGTVEIDGHDILKEPKKAKAKIGYLPEKPPVYMDMTVDEYLDFCASLKGVGKEQQAKHIEEICALTGIGEVRKRLCKNLSKGYVQRLGIAQALIGNPEILILDEPTIGLDPNQIIQIRNLIKKLGKKHTIIVSSHILAEVTQICHRIIILSKGKIAACDTLDNLKKSLNENDCIEVRIKKTDESFSDELKKIKDIVSVVPVGELEGNSFDFIINCKKGGGARESIFNAAVNNKKEIIMMRPKENTLEDIFLQVTRANEEKEK
ncbi:MAG: ABC transporter ATP-binding protein [Eubacteriales bacterium]